MARKQIILHVTPQEHKRLLAAAKAAQRTIAKQVLHMLIQGVPLTVDGK